MIGYIAERAFVKRSLVTPAMRRQIIRELTYTEYSRDAVKSTKQYKAGGFGSAEMRVKDIENYWKRGDYVSLPRQWAMDNFKGNFEDRTKFPILPGMRHHKRIEPRDKQQEKFFAGLLKSAQKKEPVQILANATTGAGKTVAQIWLGQQLATRTLLVVDSNKIANGYLKNFIKFFGEEWTEENVGRIQQDECETAKPFVIAMVQSLASRHYPPKTYQSFGLVCFDEVQIYGNLAYHRVLGMFNARVKAGFTATNKKGDFGKVITGYIGKPAVLSTQTVMEPEAHVVTFKLPRTVSVYSDGALINDLVKIASRNDLIADMVVNRGYNRGRVVLVLSERVEQLQAIQKRLIRRKVPAKDIGLHVAEYEDGSYTVGYSYDDGHRWLKLKLSFTQHLADKLCEELSFAKRTSKALDRAYIPASVKKHIQKNGQVGIRFCVMRNTVKPSEEELDSIANSCMVILATTKIFGKGVDYPRIDMGVEATPIGNVTQPLGRVTRLLEGKKTPEWWAIYDRFVLEGNRAQRFGNVEVAIDDDLVEAINAFFKGKHDARKRGIAIAGGKLVYHKAEEIGSEP